jgi:hypothetical protein
MPNNARSCASWELAFGQRRGGFFKGQGLSRRYLRCDFPKRMYSSPCYHRSCANHRFCAAIFCSSLFRQRCLAFPCFALPRRHCSPARPSLGCQPQCLAYQLLCAFFSLLYVGNFFLGRLRPSICSDWYELWRDSWLARSRADPLGKTIGRTFLHAEPLARASGYPGDCGTFCVRLVACCALRPFRRTAFAGYGLRNAAFSGSRSRVNRLLPRLFYWSADPHCASRASGRRLNVASVGSEPLAHAATGITRADDATQSVPHGVHRGTHRVPWQRCTGFGLIVTKRNVIFDIREVLPGILEERIIAGLIRVLELFVRTAFRVRLF